MILFYFFETILLSDLKSILLLVLLCSFSGQPFFDAWLRRGYNVIFTALPIFAIATLEQDVNDLGLLKFPHLYRECQRNTSFSKARIAKWLLFGVLDSALLYYFSRLTVYGTDFAFDSSGQTPGLYTWGTLCFTCLVWLVNFRLAIHTRLVFHFSCVTCFFSSSSFVCVCVCVCMCVCSRLFVCLFVYFPFLLFRTCWSLGCWLAGL
jgi:phospholipid-translocating ATPase